ncbi:carbamate kinase, partial [Thermococcus sp.]
MKRVVIALGGNAILQRGQKGSYEEQMGNVMKTAGQIVDIILKGDYEVVITHGNGPQVGALLLHMDAGQQVHGIPAQPMDVAGAMTQGQIGYMIQQAIVNELRRRGIEKPVATIVTQTLVDKNDPAFQHPSKPVGPFYDEETAKKLAREKGWTVIEDSGRGWRRVVPSPDPKGHVEAPVIVNLVEKGFIVIASGGGGVPVIEEEGQLKGVEAVIDKDLAGERLAEEVRADVFMILTDV